MPQYRKLLHCISIGVIIKTSFSYAFPVASHREIWISSSLQFHISNTSKWASNGCMGKRVCCSPPVTYDPTVEARGAIHLLICPPPPFICMVVNDKFFTLISTRNCWSWTPQIMNVRNTELTGFLSEYSNCLCMAMYWVNAQLKCTYSRLSYQCNTVQVVSIWWLARLMKLCILHGHCALVDRLALTFMLWI